MQRLTTTIYRDRVENVCSAICPDNAPQVDLVISSPPYNIGKCYEKVDKFRNYLDWHKKIISSITPIVKDTGSLCWQVGNYIHNGVLFPIDIYVHPIFEELGWKLRNRIIWHFEHGLHCSKRFSGRYETLLWYTRTDDYKFNLDSVRVPSKYPNKKYYKGPKKGQLSGNPKGKNPSDFWKFLRKDFNDAIFEIPNVKHNHVEKTIHPCQFPTELVERCVLAFTDEYDIVMDPFAGVGTTGIAALRNKRNSVLVENSLEYCDLAQKRLTDCAKGTLRTREIGTPIYSPPVIVKKE